MKEAWLEAVRKAFPQGEARPAYPLLGEELSEQPRPSQPWRLRLTLCHAFDEDQLRALSEDVEEVRLLGAASAHQQQLASRELFLEEDQNGSAPPVNSWALVQREATTLGALTAQRDSWQSGSHHRLEQTVWLDGALLRNLALLRQAPISMGEVDRWVVTPSPPPPEQAFEDRLIAETLAYWTGAVAGVQVLEVIQRPQEGFEALWTRLNICRLLRWEAGLADGGDACAGAGLFSQLATLS
jgi:hypothetical protein